MLNQYEELYPVNVNDGDSSFHFNLQNSSTHRPLRLVFEEG